VNDVDDIRQQMALIRREMHQNVSSVVSDVGDAMDWRSPLRKHPYLTIGVGLAVGYFLVPRRKSQAAQARQALADVAPRLAAIADADRQARPEKPPKSLGRRLAGWGIGMLWPLVGQSAQAYAAMWLENQLKQHLTPGPPGGFTPPSSSGRPGEPYEGEPARRAARRG